MKKIIAIFLSAALCICLNIVSFAANETNTLGVTFSAELDQDSLNVSDTEQQVVLTVKASSAVSTSSISYTAAAEGLQITALEGDGTNVTDATTNLTTGKFSWSASGGAATSVETIAKVTVTVPANTAAGTYEIGVTGIKLSKDYGMTIIENRASASATLTVSEATPAAPGYTVALSSDAPAAGVAKGADFNVNLDVSNTEATTFNAFSGILTYDKSKVSYTGNGSIDEFGVENDSDAGTLKITRANGDVDISKDPDLSLPFKAEAAGDAVFELTSASVKVDEAANAEGHDAPVAAVEDSPLTVKVLETYTITFTGGEGATGDAPSIGPFTAGKKFNLPGAGSLTRDGFVFSGWNDGTDNYSEGAEYTMPAGNVTFTAQWTEDIIVTPASANPTAYFGSQYKLIAATINASGYVPTYDGNEMFQVQGYDDNTWYYVIDGTYDSSKFGYTAGTGVTIQKPDNDVNQTSIVDINDAQFVYNIYNGTTPTQNIVQRLLLADTNRDKTVNTQDCAVVVQAI